MNFKKRNTIYYKNSMDILKKVNKFISKDKKDKEEVISTSTKDGLYERHEIINKKMVTTDGRQLLKEQLFEI